MTDLSATTQCVKCGLCLPHCPTFRLTGNEADSPRGRISLMQLLDQPADTWSPGLYRHLDRCLMCHACEAMCPSKVPFDRLMDAARQRLESHRPHPWRHRLRASATLPVLTTAAGRRLAAFAITLARRLRLAGLPGLPASLRRLLRLLPPAAPTCAPVPAEPAAPGGRVSLFTGCTGELLDTAALQDARILLNRLGYAVDLPARQACCGALHQHSGRPQKARQLASRNLQAFAGDAPVIGFASGCCAHLKAYGSLYPDDGEAFAARVADISAFLGKHPDDELAFSPLPETVALHLPCTQRNRLGAAPVRELLARIPQLDVREVNPEGGCCGAAGSYMLTQPALSDRLRDDMVEKVLATGSRTLLTTNIGCSLQLAAGLRARGADLTLMHPVSLLRAQLKD